MHPGSDAAFPSQMSLYQDCLLLVTLIDVQPRTARNSQPGEQHIELLCFPALPLKPVPAGQS